MNDFCKRTYVESVLAELAKLTCNMEIIIDNKSLDAMDKFKTFQNNLAQVATGSGNSQLKMDHHRQHGTDVYIIKRTQI